MGSLGEREHPVEGELASVTLGAKLDVFDGIGDAALVTDEQGRYVDANEAASRLLGYSKAEFLDMSIGDLVSAGRDFATEEFDRFLADGAWRGELELRCKDGDTVRVEARATLLPESDEGGRFISILREVGGPLWEGLAPSSAALAAIVQTSDDAIIGKDLDGIIRSWNAGAQKMYGYAPDEVIGKHISVLNPERIDEFRAIMERLRRGEHIDHFETVRKRNDGTVLDVSLTISPIADQTGRLVGASTIARDITERRRMEDRLERIAQLTLALRGKEDEEEILRLALEAVQEALGAERSAALLCDTDGVMRFRTWNGLSEGYREAVEGHNPWDDGETDPQPVVVADVRSDASLSELLPVIEQEGIGSLVFIPLAHQDHLLGKFMAYFPEPHAIDEDELEHVQTIASHVAFWIDLRRTDDELRAARDLLDVITAGAGDGITIQDPSGKVIYVNDATARYSGFSSPEEMLATPYEQVFERFDLMDETGARFPIEDLPGRRALRGEEEPETVLQVRDRRDGSITWRVVSARPVFDDARDVRYAVNVLTDITAQRIAELRFRRLFEASIVGIILVDETTILEANDAFLEMTGYTAEDLRAGQIRWTDMTPPEWGAADEQAWEQVYETGVIAPLEKEFIRKDGSRVPIILAATMLQASPYQAVCFVIDTTQRKQAEIERIRLLEQEQAARAEAETAREQLAFLLRASGLLAASLDYEQTLSQVAKLVVPRLADWATIQVLEEDGTLRPLAIAHVDPAKVEMAQELQRRYPTDMSAPYGVPKVIRTGRAEVVSEILPSMLDEVGLDDELRRIITDLQLRSTMTVPLAARGRVFGAITLVWAESGRNYTQDDLPLVEELAARAALAIDNARLFQERDHIAVALQRSLLPPELPTIPTVELAARYRASGAGNEVGGDFYDVFETGDGNWSLLIGDVCGKGPEAAALMGVARHTVRTASMQEHRPSRILSILNEGILRQSSDGRFCTVCYVRMHPREDGARLTVATGGHPLPLILRADGSVEQAGVPGTLIGVLEDPEITDLALELGPRDAMVLYTDGVTDEQNDEQEFGEHRLTKVIRSCAGKDAEEIARTIEQAVIDFAPGVPRDDIAILVARVRP
ncbi:MAG: PAS domain S-box protein [Actinomycetota bacterium]